jgi:glutamine synthetase
MLPTSLSVALDSLTAGHMLRDAFGTEFIDHYATIKRAEVRRYETTVTDWEMREYFDIF